MPEESGRANYQLGRLAATILSTGISAALITTADSTSAFGYVQQLVGIAFALLAFAGVYYLVLGPPGGAPRHQGDRDE